MTIKRNQRSTVSKVYNPPDNRIKIFMERAGLDNLTGSNMDKFIDHILNTDIHLTKEEADKIKDLIASVDLGISKELLDEIYGRIDGKADKEHSHVGQAGIVATSSQIQETEDKQFVSKEQINLWNNRYSNEQIDDLLKNASAGDVDLTGYATEQYVDEAIAEIQLTPGPQGPKGEDGRDGKDFTYDDFTEEQLESLRGPAGPKGEAGTNGKDFTYDDFTTDQLESLRGPQGPKGETGAAGSDGKAFTYDDFTEEQLEALRGPMGPQGPAGEPVDTSMFYDKDEIDEMIANVSAGDIDLTGYATEEYVSSAIQKIELTPGPQGPRGERGEAGPAGEKGERGEAGPQGERGEAGPAGERGERGEMGPQGLQGVAGPAGPKGERGEVGPQGPKGDTGAQGPAGRDGKDANMLYPEEMDHIVVNPMGGFLEGENIAGLTLVQIIEKMLCGNADAVDPSKAPTFIGRITPYKKAANITYDDLTAETMKRNEVVFPTVPGTTVINAYTHSTSARFGTAIIAFPTVKGSIVGIVDAAGISITGAYEVIQKTLTVPGMGDIEYTISAAISNQTYNSGTAVKWITA